MNMYMAAKQAAQEYLESGIEIDNIDIRQAQVYIASAWTREKVVQEGLAKLIPRRKYKHGSKPGITTKELNTKANWEDLKTKASSYGDGSGTLGQPTAKPQGLGQWWVTPVQEQNKKQKMKHYGNIQPKPSVRRTKDY